MTSNYLRVASPWIYPLSNQLCFYIWLWSNKFLIRPKLHVETLELISLGWKDEIIKTLAEDPLIWFIFLVFIVLPLIAILIGVAGAHG